MSLSQGRALMQSVGFTLIFASTGERYDSVRQQAESVERDRGLEPGHVVRLVRLVRLGYAKGGNVVEKASIVVSQ